MDASVVTTCSSSEDDALQEADDFMGPACAVNISEVKATRDIKPPNIKKRKIIEAGKEEPVTREYSAKAIQIESSTGKNVGNQMADPGESVVQKKKRKRKKKKNLIADGQDQASTLLKQSVQPQESQIPCASGDSATNPSKTNLNKKSSTAVVQSSKLEKHQAVPAGAAPNHCTACNITFRTPARLNRHRHKAHSTEHSFRCPDCKKTFPNPGAVNQHRIMMHNVQNIYQCRECNLVVKNESCLNQHHRIFHGFSKCSECSEECSSLALLKQHQWEAHNIGKLLTCRVCSETFINFTKFMKHQKSHTYPCTVCNSTFKKPGQLRKHEMTHM